MNKEELREKILAFVVCAKGLECSVHDATREIMSLISQSQNPQQEHLEVEIKEWDDPINDARFHLIFMNSSIRDKVFLKARTKEEIIDFCTKHGLKVINKETIK